MATNKSRESSVVYPELSYTIVGCCFNAHNELGRYAREKQYGDHLEKQFVESGVSYERELAVGDSGNILDFLVDDKVVLEIKSVRVMTKKYYYQIQNYLQQSGVKLGILINFREKHLKPRRVLRADHL